MISKIPSRHCKYRLIFMIMRYMGRRPCEVCPIQYQDIDFADQSIQFLIGKTNLLTKVPVPDLLWRELQIYIQANRHTFTNGYIFPGSTSQLEHLSEDTAGRFFRCLADSVGLNRTYGRQRAHYRVNRFYDLVGSCATDVTIAADTKQAMIVRRHTDERAIKHYQYVAEISKERTILNQIERDGCKKGRSTISSGEYCIGFSRSKIDATSSLQKV